MVRVPGMRRALSPAGDFRALFFLRSLILSYRPHIVHTHASKGGFLGRTAVLLAGRGPGARFFPGSGDPPGAGRPPAVVHTFHGHVLDGYFGPLRSSFFREVERALAARTDVIVAVSDSVRRELLDRHRVGRPEQYRIIPSGGQALPGPLRDGSKGLRGELGLGAGPVGGIVGRLVPVKGHGVLLAALSSILAEAPGLKILVVGDGPLRPRIERFKKRRPEGRALEILGPRSDIGRVLAALDFLVLPSFKEGLPTVLIEAALAGVPIVASSIPGVTDLFRNGISALLFSPSSPPALARAVLDLSKNRGLAAALAAGARKEVERKVMSPAAVVEAHAALYGELHKKPCARPGGAVSFR